MSRKHQSLTLTNNAMTFNVNLFFVVFSPSYSNLEKVTMSSNPFKTMVSLILPSALIMIADLVSFALPLTQGKRSSFKITLVLSFTMFLLILTDYIPNSGPCSPLIRKYQYNSIKIKMHCGYLTSDLLLILLYHL